jgi:competence protein ComEC
MSRGMGDAWVVGLAVAAWTGATVSRPASLPGAVVVAVLGLLLRRPAVLCVGVLVVASALGARAWSGLSAPEPSPADGWVTLVSDPVDFGNAVRVDVRVGSRRMEAWARGPARATLLAGAVGDRASILGRVRAVPDEARRRLAVRHIAARLSIDTVRELRPAAGVYGVANALRHRLLDGARSLPRDVHALYAGVVLGDDRGQPPEVVDDFRGAGLTHLLAVSGQNVAFALLLVAPLLRLLGRRTRAVVALAVVGVFGVVTRWEPSVVRASIMAAVAILAAASGRPQAAVRVLGLAVTLALLVDPLLVHATGFRLSVAATAGIALLAGRLVPTVPGPRWLATAVAVPLAAELAVAPLLLTTFGPVPLVSLPANLLAAPLAGPLMTWGMGAGLAAGFMPEWTAALVHVPTRFLTQALATVAHAGAAAPLPSVGAFGVGVLAAALGAWVACRSQRGRRRVLVALGALVMLHLAIARDRGRWGDDVASGVTVWQAAGATVVALHGARDGDALAGLRHAGIGGIDVVLLADDGAGEALAAVSARHHVGTLVVGAGSRFAGLRVPASGTELRVGPIVITAYAQARGLAFAVARAPPG